MVVAGREYRRKGVIKINCTVESMKKTLKYTVPVVSL